MRDLILTSEDYTADIKTDSQTDISTDSVAENEGFNIIQLISSRGTDSGPFISCELSPANIIMEIFDEYAIKPLFYSITWHSLRNSFSLIDGNVKGSIPAFTFAEKIHMEGKNVLLHVVCAGMTKEKLDFILSKARNSGIRNIFALQGDRYRRNENPLFCYASELVRYVREVYGNYFSIGVAGYPEGHPESASKLSDMKYLKQKVKCGADFIITQAFLDVQYFFDFVTKCRENSIRVPIIPGIFIFETRDCLKKMSAICSIDVPLRMRRDLENLDEGKVRAYGIKTMEIIVERILDNYTDCPGIHFFTLNKVRTTLDLASKIFVKKIDLK